MDVATLPGMKTLFATGILVFTVGTAGAAYLVDIDGGDRVTVDGIREEGDQVHLMQGEAEMVFPKSRIRRIEEIDDADAAAAASKGPAAGEDEDRAEIEARKARIEKHLLRVQAARFEADARGDDPRERKKLSREFKRTQQRRIEAAHELQSLDAN